ncbi:hypothetical protein ILYODFUR_033314 [Ilyodon furcidens]|uniref:Uncharacterized protein n=1 Tax=Ilyodon furcidens TaxID=33524 RepID=A0ABV0TQQ7_9TELE
MFLVPFGPLSAKLALFKHHNLRDTTVYHVLMDTSRTMSQSSYKPKPNTVCPSKLHMKLVALTITPYVNSNKEKYKHNIKNPCTLWQYTWSPLTTAVILLRVIEQISNYTSNHCQSVIFYPASSIVGRGEAGAYLQQSMAERRGHPGVHHRATHKQPTTHSFTYQRAM